MVRGISVQARSELLEDLRERYRGANRREKSRILNEFVALARSHRKHAIRLLGCPGVESARAGGPSGKRIYNEAVRETLNTRVPVRTFADRTQPLPGFLEVDYVAHCGGVISGSYTHSLVATDVCAGWTEAIPLLVREQSLVVQRFAAIARQLPVPIRGIDSDNAPAFVNETLIDYCANGRIELTRSRAYRKNDQA